MKKMFSRRNGGRKDKKKADPNETGLEDFVPPPVNMNAGAAATGPAAAHQESTTVKRTVRTVAVPPHPQQQHPEVPLDMAPAVVAPLEERSASSSQAQNYTPPSLDLEPAPVEQREPSSTPLSSAALEESALVSLEHQAARANLTRELVRKYVSDIWNCGDCSIISKICSKNLRFNGSVGLDRVGHEGFEKMVTTIRDSLGDYHCEIHSMVVEGNKAFCRMRFTGFQTGPLLGYPPTGRRVSWMGASEFTIRNKMITKIWELGDVKSLEDQLKAPMEGNGM